MRNPLRRRWVVEISYPGETPFSTQYFWSARTAHFLGGYTGVVAHIIDKRQIVTVRER